MRTSTWAMLLLIIAAHAGAAPKSGTIRSELPHIYGGNVAGEEIQLRFHTDAGSRSIVGATLRPAIRETRLIEGKWLDKRRITAVERSSATTETARIRAVYDNGEIRGTWKVSATQKAVPFTLRVIRTSGYIDLLNDGSLEFEPFDRISRAIDDGRWDEAIFSATLLYGLSEWEWEWPKVVAALSRASVPRTKIEQKELRALVAEIEGDRAVAKQWYTDECNRGLIRFSCDRLLSLTPPSAAEERRNVVQLTCERQRLACAEYWGAPEVALIEACERGDADAVRSILSTRVNLRAGGKRLPTAIVAATNKGSLEIVTLLLDHGADPNFIGGGYDRLPLLIAVEKRRPDIALQLLEHGADPNTPGIYGSPTALEVAACERESSVVHAMLERGANPDEATSQTGSALICAVDNDDEPMVRELLQHGATPSISGKFSLGSALDHAKQAKNERLIALLSGRQP